MIGGDDAIVPAGVESIKAERDSRKLVASPEPATSTWAETAKGNYALIRDPRAEAYLQKIVNRLLEHWHGEKREHLGIFLMTGDAHHYLSSPSGDILVPIGSFDILKNEDELAALIGHELGHVLLKHAEKQKEAHMIADAASFAASLYFDRSLYKNSAMHRYGDTREIYIRNPKAVQKDAIQSMTTEELVITLSQDIALSAFNRQHEYEADVFGMRLAGNSGWDPNAIMDLIQRWGDADAAKQKKDEERLRNAGLAAGLTEGFKQISSQIVASHPSSESRRENVVKDYQVAFKGAAPKKPTEISFNQAINSGEFARKRELWRNSSRN